MKHFAILIISLSILFAASCFRQKTTKLTDPPVGLREELKTYVVKNSREILGSTQIYSNGSKKYLVVFDTDSSVGNAVIATPKADEPEHWEFKRPTSEQLGEYQLDY